MAVLPDKWPLPTPLFNWPGRRYIPSRPSLLDPWAKTVKIWRIKDYNYFIRPTGLKTKLTTWIALCPTNLKGNQVFYSMLLWVMTVYAVMSWNNFLGHKHIIRSMWLGISLVSYSTITRGNFLQSNLCYWLLLLDSCIHLPKKCRVDYWLQKEPRCCCPCFGILGWGIKALASSQAEQEGDWLHRPYEWNW